MDYASGGKMVPILLKQLADEMATGGNGKIGPYGLVGRVCSKVNDTAPADDTAADFPNAIGDFCLHYNAAGTFQAVYLAISGDLATTCDWVKITDI